MIAGTQRAARWLLPAALLAAPPPGAAQGGPAESPFVRLYDTRAPVERLDGRPAVAAWTLVPPGRATHAFRGDAAIANDRLTVHLGSKAFAATVVSRRSAAGEVRAALAPLPAPSGAGLKVVENTPGAVTIEAGGACFRLTTGSPLVEVRPAAAAKSLRIAPAGCRYVVVPDYCAGDLAWPAEGDGPPLVALPAENCLLGLLDGGGIAAVVWPSVEQQATAVFDRRGARGRAKHFEVELAGGEGVWVALLDAPGLWHVRSGDGGEWRPPFPARWRCSAIGAGRAGRSWELGRPRPNDAAGRAVVYPLERTGATPLDAFCLVDVFRAALGAGPCEYVLEVEGLATDVPATCDYVARWVERQFQRGRARGSAPEIRRRLEAMVAHVGRVADRIDGHRALAGALRQLCESARKRPASGEVAAALLEIVGDMERDLRVGDGEAAPAAARRLADAMASLIGRADAIAACGKLGAELRLVGATQDRMLARARMQLRRLRQHCRTAGPTGPAAKELVGEVGRRVSAALAKKTRE